MWTINLRNAYASFLRPRTELSWRWLLMRKTRFLVSDLSISWTRVRGWSAVFTERPWSGVISLCQVKSNEITLSTVIALQETTMVVMMIWYHYERYVSNAIEFVGKTSGWARLRVSCVGSRPIAQAGNPRTRHFEVLVLEILFWLINKIFNMLASCMTHDACFLYDARR